MKTRILSILLLLAFLSFFNRTYAQDYYPLNDGDFWEYIKEDTITVEGGVLGVHRYSYIKEIIGDTLMPNGITYKKIKWENASNIVDKNTRYEYERKDASGNIHMYYNGQEFLLYDFNKNVGETYPSHLPGWDWKIERKGFNDPSSGISYHTLGLGRDTSLRIVQFILVDSIGNVRDDNIMLENIGMVEYHYSESYTDPFGQYYFYNTLIWGALINGTVYGDLLARKQKINWFEYYPLHVGDFWILQVWEDFPIQYKKVIRVTHDSLMSDGNIYFKRDGQYERIDSLGSIYVWDTKNNSAIRILQLSPIIGDTLTCMEKIQITGKSFDWVNYSLGMGSYESQSLKNGYNFTRKIGMIKSKDSSSHRYSEEILGAYIDGVVYGDTTYNYNKPDTAIAVENNSEIITKYALDQNYPNPFNPATNIVFQLPKESFVSLVVYNVLGEEVETLLNEYRAVGKHTVTFDAHNLPSGIYFYTLQTNGLTETKKMLLLK